MSHLYHVTLANGDVHEVLADSEAMAMAKARVQQLF
jgi:hypothetical protein